MNLKQRIKFLEEENAKLQNEIVELEYRFSRLYDDMVGDD